jgi:predicted transcriptional regulator
MKAILISIKPEWVDKILNGKKTIEIRKTAPNCKLPIDVYIYCTKKQPYGRSLIKYQYCNEFYIDDRTHNLFDEIINGKIAAKFTLNKIDKIDDDPDIGAFTYAPDGSVLPFDMIEFNDILREKACVDGYENLDEYLGFIGDSYNLNTAYLWYIDDLEIFDKPRELADFGLTRPPQSWQYIEVGK